MGCWSRLLYSSSVLGPSTIRDTVGSFVNVFGGDPWYNASVNGNNEFLDESVFLHQKF